MRIKLSIIIFVLNSIYCFSQSNEGVALYKVKTSYTFKNIKKNKDKEALNKYFERSGTENSVKFKLIFKKDKSVFFAENILQRDDDKIDLVRIQAKILGKIYVNQKNKEVVQHKEKFGEFFNIVSNLENYEWILTKEQIQIGKYTCYKAILKNKRNNKNQTIAWYTPRISNRVGPVGYCNLPGLVVLLQDDIFIYSLENIIFNLTEKDEIKLSRPKKGQKVSLQQYDSIYNVMRDYKDKLERENYMRN